MSELYTTIFINTSDELHLDMVGVAGSNPVASTIYYQLLTNSFQRNLSSVEFLASLALPFLMFSGVSND